MIRKRAKKASAAKAPAKKKASPRKHMDPEQVREQISGMVKSGAKGITRAVMDQAMHGELAPAKYLFEVARIYPPANDGESATQEEDCLAKTLLARLDARKPPVTVETGEEEEEDQSADAAMVDAEKIGDERAGDSGEAADESE